MRNNLYPEFKKNFLLPMFAKRWMTRFSELSLLKQHALIKIMQLGVSTGLAFDAIEETEPDDLLLNFNQTVEDIGHHFSWLRA